MQSRAPAPAGSTGPRRVVLALALAALSVPLLPLPAEAQYFGRNKVQYDDFDFRVLETPHWDVHYYVEQENISDIARMAERWYERLARTFQHEFEADKPLIMYADHTDFQQTNTLSGMLTEGTGGVTESLKNRVIMPQTGSYADTDHVLGHEIVHAFQYNIAQSSRGGGMQGLGALPLWLIEGMAEYLSVGRDAPLTAMWLRDAIRRDDFPTIRQMTREQRFFPYRFGQAMWAYVGGTYSDDAVTQLFRRSLRIGFQPAIEQILGVSHDTLSAEWRRTVERQYAPLMEGRQAPADVGRRLLGPENAGEQYNISPALSPDGRYIAFLSEKDLFSVDMYLADAQTGEVIRRLTSANADPHFDALRYVESSGDFSPDGEMFVFAVFAEGDNALVIVETADGDTWRRVEPLPGAALNHPSWSPDGRYIAFTGIVGGVSDLYLYDIEENRTIQLTDDKHADFHPEWSPDGSTIAFSSDRGPETDFETLNYSRDRIALIDVETRRVRTLDLLGDVNHSNPAFGPDGQALYFLSDYDGFRDIFRTDLTTGSVERITRIMTGVSGITFDSPALSVASEAGTLAFSVFDEFAFRIHTLPADPPGQPVRVVTAEEGLQGRNLPPVEPDRFSRVAEYLADPGTGLPPVGEFPESQASDYSPSLALDYIGQPTIGVGADRFGNYIGGGAAAYFSDMLGNQVLGVALQAQGTFKDIGGQIFYTDLGDRWNWGVGGARIPYILLFQRLGTEDETNRPFVGQVRQRIYVSTASGQVSYPFSTTRRFESSLGVTRYASDVEEDRFYLDQFGRVVEHDRVDIEEAEFEPLNMAQASAALVGDNSFFGFTSPIRGGRWRLELEGTAGDLDFLTGIADWRRYFSPHTNLTMAVRGLHYGRYGNVTREGGALTSRSRNLIQPLFLGFETLVRGYAYESFGPEECALSADIGGVGGSCPTLSRLFGHKIAVTSAEFRIPLLGVEQYGLIEFPFVPTELVLFSDAGVAWDAATEGVDDDIHWEFSRSTADRVPVFSSGVSARFNVLGFMVLEAYYAYPWQRPDKGWHWGFQIAPGW